MQIHRVWSESLTATSFRTCDVLTVTKPGVGRMDSLHAACQIEPL